MTYGLNSDAKQIISGLKSRLGRTEERVTVLEGIVQSANAERDMYMQRAVELEQLISRLDGAVTAVHLKYQRRDREEFTGESVSALDAVAECLAVVHNVIAEDAKESVA